MVRAKSISVIILVFVVVVSFASPQTVFAAGAISEGFTMGEVLPEWIGWAIVVGLGGQYLLL